MFTVAEAKAIENIFNSQLTVLPNNVCVAKDAVASENEKKIEI